MRLQRQILVLAAAALAWSGLTPTRAAAQEYEAYPLEARVWLDRGEEPVLRRGEQVRVYYRVSQDAFVSVFHIDSNGTVRMVFPSSPQENHYARGGRDYRILFPGSSYWYVDDDPGMGYFFIVASPEPFDFSSFQYSHYAGGWDLSYVGRQVYGDPYLAMDDFVAALIPDWEYVAYGLDFTAYHVDGHYDYPRFLCYDCHGFRPYYTWNPYAYTCASFRVVIYDDPYYYPATRYRGTRVVYAAPRRGIAHFDFKERAVGESGAPEVVVRTTPPPTRPGVEGTANRRAVPREGMPSAGSSGTAPGRTIITSPGVPRTDPRGSQASGATRPTDPSRVTQPPTGGSTSGRPVLERRPPSTGRSVTPPGTGTTSRTTPPSRPSSRIVRPGGGTTTPPTTTTRPPGGGSTARPTTTTRPPGGGSTARPTTTTRPPGGGSTARPTTTTRPPGGGSTARPTTTTRPPGGGSTARPTTTTRPPGGGSTARPTTTTRPPGGGSTARPTTTTRPPGGGSTARPTTTTRPPGGGSTARPTTRRGRWEAGHAPDNDPRPPEADTAARPPPVGLQRQDPASDLWRLHQNVISRDGPDPAASDNGGRRPRSPLIRAASLGLHHRREMGRPEARAPGVGETPIL